ncbi:2-hydroxyacid dehydrogenase [Halapricum desulfuricans]|uniref:Phosphoglycerate dehydrogenase or related dehydrogenase n=1 Tax=Halapricum desulfuricans TaxID=2841257 RepID=A0A897MRN2_9EURY|nr:2-hydroxyacid dehydrogenase [Halapricum desulfuricans]QSG04800.1 Phosphoglycerate dehydrogenase or related dehydrogenase [Halapricum desulfuricans]
MNAFVAANLSEDGIERLESLGLDVEYDPIEERDGRMPIETLKRRLEDVEIFVSGFEGVPAEVMDAATDLEVIACPRGGPEASVDIGAATERGIPVLYAPGRNAETVADHTLGLLLSVTRNISLAHHRLREGTYTGSPSADAAEGGEREDVTWGIGRDSPYVTLRGPELGTRTLGIVGFGRIGRRVAKRAKDGFNMSVIAYDPFVDHVEMEPFGVEKVTNLQELCRRSDVVSLHADVNPTSRDLVGSGEFKAMPDHAFFINTARASIIQEGTLVEALRNDEIRGAAMDVYHQEPIAEDDPLLRMDNVVTTPHIASASQDVIDRHSELIVRDIEALLSGEDPMHVKNPETLDDVDLSAI